MFYSKVVVCDQLRYKTQSDSLKDINRKRKCITSTEILDMWFYLKAQHLVAMALNINPH